MDLSNVNIIDNTLIIQLDGEIKITPEELANEEERELFKEWRELYPDGKPTSEEPIYVEEPVDWEKVAMAEAIIDLDARMAILEAKGGD
ncbi:MAG: hypothetical protein K0S61_119 [Anaerocolumna sp.]|nr:hypothetical protein [Anaerocolumna sp.]